MQLRLGDRKPNERTDLAINRVGRISSGQRARLLWKIWAWGTLAFAFGLAAWLAPPPYSSPGARAVFILMLLILGHDLCLLSLDLAGNRVALASGRFSKTRRRARGVVYCLEQERLSLYLTETQYHQLNETKTYHVYYLPYTKKVMSFEVVSNYRVVFN
jgi:hypothetical protein